MPEAEGRRSPRFRSKPGARRSPTPVVAAYAAPTGGGGGVIVAGEARARLGPAPQGGGGGGVAVLVGGRGRGLRRSYRGRVGCRRCWGGAVAACAAPTGGGWGVVVAG